MSRENVETLRQTNDAFNRRDKAAWLALIDPGFVSVPPRNWPEQDPTCGAEACWDLYVGDSDTWEEGPYEYVELIDAGNDQVVAHQRREMRGKASGADVVWSYWVVVTFRNRKALRIEWFVDRGEALEAAGLRE
jgi:ketosteroid isomerase-like protein